MPTPSEEFNVLSSFNEYFREMREPKVVDLRNYPVGILPWMKKVSKKSELHALAGGKGVKQTIRTSQPLNARTRKELRDVQHGRPDAFKELTINEVETIAVVGMTDYEMIQCRRNGIGNRPEQKLKLLMEDLENRWDVDLHGDGTGRLGYVGSVSGSVLTLTNTEYNWGIEGTKLFTEEQVVDVYTPATAVTDFAPKVLGAVVRSLTGTTVTLDTTGAEVFDTIAAGDVVFNAGSVDWDPETLAVTGFNQSSGLMHLIDDGTATDWTLSGGRGSRLKTSYFGLDRSLYGTLRSDIESYYDGTSPASWPLQILFEHMDDIRDRKVGKVRAVVCGSKMTRCIARKAAAENNATVNLGAKQEVKPGVWCKTVNYDGEDIPIVTVSRFRDNAIALVDTEPLRMYMPDDIHYVNPNEDPSRSAEEIWFRSPKTRNLTYEAWARHFSNQFAERCDAFKLLEGLRNDEY